MPELLLGTKFIKTDRPAFVMGIINATPDSFFSESRGGIQRALKLIEDGADILDIGGESTRPGFEEISAEEEINRIIPVIRAVRKVSSIPVSVDTRKADVLKAAVDAGADVLNDVSAMEDDEKMAEVAAAAGVSVILMHRFNGSEESRKTNPSVVEEVSSYLESRVAVAVGAGIPLNKIIVDPGIGFGKTYEENLDLIRNTDRLCSARFPVLMALSRKRCIGTMTGKNVENRMAGTIAADILSVQKGAIMVRVHDVAETVDAMNVMKYLK